MPASAEGVLAETEGLTMVMRSALKLRGVVRSSAGVPLPGARLKLEFAGAYPTLQLNADAKGRFERLVPRDEPVDIWVAPRRTDTSEPYEYVLVSARWLASEEPLELVR